MNTRQQQISQYIHDRSQVSISELERLCPDVSSMTIRRDLESLEQSGILVRIHGGARSIHSLSRFSEEIYGRRAMEHINFKQEIAKKAAELVADGMSIYLDAGSTAMYFSQKMPNRRAFITTSGPNIATELLKNDQLTINLLGGQLNPDTISVSGIHAIDYLRSINIDTAFIAASGFSCDSGFTNGNSSECELKRAALSRAQKRIVLMDSSKVGKTMPFTFAQPSGVDILVTDSGIDDETRRYIEDCGVFVV